ncbi:hypothetical protein ES044_16440 [Polaribacter sp. IC066]|uniref:hypothetical protein n=1 Tax=Polaribacter sp. IC066 TaxID=57032 RepID=UPI0011BEFBA2|nr:hypothetical protein [Polaribacter sp. IC066]TXD56693.1 hypothetical protein ES044_16440 [Polaribacter sp. IC066]
MSKILVIAYKNSQPNVEENLKKAFSCIEPQNIKNELKIIQPISSINTFIGVLNPEYEINSKTSEIISGYVRGIENKSEALEDGSYLKIKWDKQHISFNVDRFESKSLWVFQDDEKFIVSNSQLLITALKKSFKINRQTVTWFLSSGSTGYQNAWDTEVNKVIHSYQYLFSLNDWQLTKTKKEYAIEDVRFSSEKDFLQKYIDFTKQVFLNLIKDNVVKKTILPLSGGNDSRLLFYIANQLEEYKNLALANWGVKKGQAIFDDKKAAKEITQFYSKPLKDYYLPSKIENLDGFFDAYIRNGDCRIDHFNAYTDQFSIFEQLFNEKYKFIIRGDIPFTEGLDLNEKMSRAHIGIPKWTDYGNYKEYVLDDLVEIQEKDTLPISKKEKETLIEWRDRLYIDFRVPIVISSFDDLINPYVVTIAPMMSYSHFLLYSQQKSNKKGDKAHLVKLSKQLDQSKVAFNASSSILSMEELLGTEVNIKYFKEYLTNMENTLFSKEMIKSIFQQLPDSIHRNLNLKESLKSQLTEFVKENIPTKIKSVLKANATRNISSLTLAYRVLMVDKVCKIFKQATL